MAEIVHCPQCDRQLRVPEDLMGYPVKCPSCGEKFTAKAGEPPGELRPRTEETIQCAHCQHELRVPDDWVGRNIKCPRCGEKMRVGGEPEAPGAEGPPRPEEPRRQPRPGSDFDEDDDDYDRWRRRRRRYMEPHRGALILVLGILSLVICGLIGPFAWSMGTTDLEAIRSGRMDPEGEGLTIAGRICGIIATVLMVLWFLCVCVSVLASGGR